jgi:ornithine--oxo-acid transaminase
MLLIKPGEHGSTYGGNPLACKVATTAVQVLLDENMTENAAMQGQYFRRQLRAIGHPSIAKISGKGLLNAIVIEHPRPDAAWDLCLKLRDNGLLAKPTHGHIIRFAPPLIITRPQVDEALDIIRKSLQDFA